MRVLDAPSRLLLGVDTMRDLEVRINFSTSVAQSMLLKRCSIGHRSCTGRT